MTDSRFDPPDHRVALHRRDLRSSLLAAISMNRALQGTRTPRLGLPDTTAIYAVHGGCPGKRVTEP
ncbi:MAG: hypothetical protein ACJ8AI_10360 [Rhodopila sp.]|jgi:hypothetical protein